MIGFEAIGQGSNTVTLGNSSVTATRLRGAVSGSSFVKDGATSTNILLAGGSDIPQSTFQTALTNPITGTGTTNYLSKWTGTGTQSSSVIFDNGTDVSIGMSAPLTGGGAARWITLDGISTYGGGVISSLNVLQKPTIMQIQLCANRDGIRRRY